MNKHRQNSFLITVPRWMVVPVAVFTFIAAASGYAEEDQHWSYSGEDGPHEWGDLSDDYRMCSEGRNQSPIDLAGAIDADLAELILDYPNRGLVGEVNTGHTLQENLNPGNFATIRGQKYEARQFHFHSPSEHRINGKSYPLEIHIVHSNSNDQLAVIGFLFVEGEENPMLNQLNGFRPPGMAPYEGPIDYNDVVTNRGEYYTYNGSLTTPPCSEGVLWVVLKNAITASKEQIDRFYDKMGADTNRPIQPRNARTILE